MTDNPNRAWRNRPIEDIMPTSRLLRYLKCAGYHTAGDVLDATPEQLADRVYGVGPKRAVEIRDKVWAAVRPAPVSAPAVEIDPPTPVFRDAVATICSLLAIGALLYFTARVLL